MNGSPSRRHFVSSLLPAVLVGVAGCSQPRPAQFEVRAKDAITLLLIITTEESDETVYERSHSFESGDVVTLGEDTLERPPYDIELRSGDELIWESSIGTCNDLTVSVDGNGNVETVEHLAC